MSAARLGTWRRPTIRLTLTIAAAWGIAHSLLYRAFSSALSGDDAKTNLFTQRWQWGYQDDNPPLFEWLATLLHHVTPGDLWTFLILKYAALTAAAGFLHLAVRRVAGERAGFAAAMGLVTLYPVGWSLHQAWTPSALLLAVVCAGLWAGLRLTAEGRARDFALFGLVLGVGLLTKYNVLLFALPLLIAGFCHKETRRRLTSWRIALIPAAALPLVLPHALWLWQRKGAYRDSLDVTLGLAGSHAERVASGLSGLAEAVIGFAVPWIFIWAIFVRRTPREGRVVPEARLFAVTTSVGVAALALSIVAFGIGEVSERYVLPIMLPFYAGGMIWLMVNKPAAYGRLLAAAAVTAAVMLVVRAISLAQPGPPYCDDCWAFVPYDRLHEALAETTPPGSIYLAREENTAGNLVAAFPEAQVLSLNLMQAMNPTDGTGRPCYYVWSESMTGGVPLFPVFAFAYHDMWTVKVDAPWQHPFRENGFRRTDWGITPLTGELYERFCVPGARG